MSSTHKLRVRMTKDDKYFVARTERIRPAQSGFLYKLGSIWRYGERLCDAEEQSLD